MRPSEVLIFNQMIFLLLTLVPLNHTMDVIQLNGQQGRVPTNTRDAEGANLEQANPDETLRQKDPVSERTLESSSVSRTLTWDTDGVTHRRLSRAMLVGSGETTDANLSGQITEARDHTRAPF